MKTVHGMLGTLAKVFFGRVRERFFFIRESFAKVGYYESLSLHTLQLVKGPHLLPPGVGQENGTAHLPFPS